MRKRLFLALALAFCIVPLIPASASSAPGSITVVSSDAQVVFPTSLVFDLKVEAPANVEDIRLHYQVDRMKYVPTTSEAWPSFVPDTTVSTSWVWDMRRATLPPGTRLSYWWTIRDEAGDSTETVPKEVVFDDNRYDWKVLDSPELTLHWYSGDSDFAQTLMDTSQDAITSLAEEIGTGPEQHVEMYIYASADDLRQAMVYPQEWTGGAAYTEYGVVVIGIGPSDLDWGIRALRHELTHLIVHAETFSPYGDLPVWLDEGLAMHNEGEPEASFLAILYNAAENGYLLSLRTISSPFSSDATQAYLSYAESRSVVDYLLDTYGSTDMHTLLMAFKTGSTIDDALTQAYGIGLDELDTDWQASLQQEVANA